jgi:SOS-response transcriptional repressor LexA
LDYNSKDQAFFSSALPANSTNVEIMKWHERMVKLMEEKGWSQTVLAERSGVPYHLITKYARGAVEQPRGSNLRRIAEALGVSEQFLLFGVASGQKVSNYVQLPNKEETLRVPKVTLVDLVKFKSGHDILNIWSGEMSTAIDTAHSASSFTVDVDDNSMLPNFSIGDTLICDPDAPIEPGDFVLAVTNGHHKAVFRKYRVAKVIANGVPKVELHPLNADYPIDLIDADHPGQIICRCMSVITKL